MEGIDALNSWKPDLGHKTRNCGFQRPKMDQKPIGQCVRMYVILMKLIQEDTEKMLHLMNY